MQTIVTTTTSPAQAWPIAKNSVAAIKSSFSGSGRPANADLVAGQVFLDDSYATGLWAVKRVVDPANAALDVVLEIIETATGYVRQPSAVSVTITPATDADVTLTSAQAIADRFKLVTGAWIVARNVIVPSSQLRFIFDNTGTYDATVKTAAGTGILVKAGTSRLLVCDATNVIDPLTALVQDTDKAVSSDVITGTNDTKYMTPLSFRGGAIVSGTAIATTSGTSHDFTGIPSWVKRITIMLSGVSTNGTSPLRFKLGAAGGIESTGYLLTTVSLFQPSGVTMGNPTDGFGTYDNFATSVWNGAISIMKLDGNTWVANGGLSLSSGSGIHLVFGSKTLSDTLTQIRLTTSNGTDAFDAGSVNIIYE